MYKMSIEEKLYKECPEKYSLGCVIGQSLFYTAYFGIGFLGMLHLQIYGFPVVSLLYVLFLATVLLLVLREYLCTHCYYYGKWCSTGWCSTGWGKLSALMFRKDSGNYQLGIKLACITWMLATIIPIAGIIGTLVLSYSFSTLVLLILFILLTPVNFISHKKACEWCKMRFYLSGKYGKRWLKWTFMGSMSRFYFWFMTMKF